MSSVGERFARWRRRAITVPAMFLAAAIYGAALPILLLAALIADLAGAGLALRPHLRLAVGLFVALLVECVGLVVLLGVFLVTPGAPARRVALTYAVQRAYVRAHFGSVRWLYGLKLAMYGDELVRPGPLVVLIRHVSTIDVLVPGYFLAHRHGLRLRYVLKRELLAEPCLDVAGHVLPNHFVSRTGEDTAKELAAIRALKRGLGPDEGVLLYPEGTRFTPEKRDQLAASARSEEVRARAASLRHLLPCRTGGALALLDEAPDADVLFVGHRGLEGLTDVASLRSGALVGRTVEVRFWREPATSVPADPAAREGWLHAQWQRLDAWLDTAPTAKR